VLELQKYLRSNKTPADLTRQFGIYCYEHPELPLVGFKYDQVESKDFKFNKLVSECRGIVLEKDSWEVVARPFDRFFNLGECPNTTKNFNWKDFNVTEKVDGSLIIVYHYNEMWHANTSGSFGLGECPNTNGETWRDLFWRASGIDDRMLYPHYTYIFELCSLYNKVVITHKKPKVYLLGMRVTENGDECNLNVVQEWGETLRVDWVPDFNIHTEEQLHKFMKEKEQGPLWEGVVARDSNGIRFKAKDPRYVAWHRLKNNGNLIMAKNVVPIVLENEMSEVLLQFPEYEEQITKVKTELDREYSNLCDVWEECKGLESQKDFAQAILPVTKFYALLFVKRKCPDTDLKALWRSSESLIVKNLYSGQNKISKQTHSISEAVCA
jgi:T4 RnlA family RNA ligase